MTRWYLSHPLGGRWPNLLCARQAFRDLRDLGVTVYAPWIEACWRDGPEVVERRDGNPEERAKALARDCEDVRACDGVLVLAHHAGPSRGQMQEASAAIEVGRPVIEVPCPWFRCPSWLDTWWDPPWDVRMDHQDLLEGMASLVRRLRGER